MEFHRTLFDLYQSGNPKEEIVGWYATGAEVTEHSVLIHEFYCREQGKRPRSSELVPRPHCVLFFLFGEV